MYKLFPRLFERKSADAGVLSGGERQMLSIGRALMLDPKLIMLDEPSLGLDPRFLSAVLQKIVELNSLGKTIVLVEQNVKKALDISAFAYILEGGSVKRIWHAYRDQFSRNDSRCLSWRNSEENLLRTLCIRSCV